MSALNFLTSEDFRIIKDPNGYKLCHIIPGFSLVLFYSNRCKYCKDFITIFKELPGTVGGCQFGMINISNNRDCAEKSKNTNTNIEYVPYIILYYNGKPYYHYQGDADINKLKQFIFEMAKKTEIKQKISQNPNVIQPKKRGTIPQYCLGNPIYGNENVCYLEMEEAYTVEGGNRSESYDPQMSMRNAGMQGTVRH